MRGEDHWEKRMILVLLNKGGYNELLILKRYLMMEFLEQCYKINPIDTIKNTTQTYISM